MSQMCVAYFLLAATCRFYVHTQTDRSILIDRSFTIPLEHTMVTSTNTDDNDKDDIILFGCKLIESAAVEIGLQHCHQISSSAQRCRTAIFHAQTSVLQIYRGMGDRYFRCGYQIYFESFCQDRYFRCGYQIYFESFCHCDDNNGDDNNGERVQSGEEERV